MATPLYRPRPARRLTWRFSLRTFFVLLTVFSVWLAYFEREHRDLRTYYFTARIVSNDGITPFKVGTIITGHFKYDLTAKDVLTQMPEAGHYPSKRNSFVVEYGGDQFVGAGTIKVSVSRFRHSEHIGAGSLDLELPQGWKAHHSASGDSLVVMLLQNHPPRSVVPNKGLPKTFEFSRFVDC